MAPLHRLRHVSAALGGPAAQPAASPAAQSSGHAAELRAERAALAAAPAAAAQSSAQLSKGNAAGVPLSAEAVRSFVIDGYYIVRAEELGADFHHTVYETACDDRGWHVPAKPDSSPPESDAWEKLPEMTELVLSPTVKGALGSLLGEDCVMHPHRALHTSNSYRDQNFHKVSSPALRTLSSFAVRPFALLTRRVALRRTGITSRSETIGRGG